MANEVYASTSALEHLATSLSQTIPQLDNILQGNDESVKNTLQRIESVENDYLARKTIAHERYKQAVDDLNYAERNYEYVDDCYYDAVATTRAEYERLCECCKKIKDIKENFIDVTTRCNKRALERFDDFRTFVNKGNVFLEKYIEFLLKSKNMIDGAGSAGISSLPNLSAEQFRNCPIDGNNGHWGGARGNSKWMPDRAYTPPPKSNRVPPYNNPSALTWGGLLDKYGIDGINYRNGEPDFSCVSKGEVGIDSYTDSRDDNFDKADIELASQKGRSPQDVKIWREKRNYTWHECRDMRTMQLVPNEIHANIPHSGGISEVKKGRVI